MNKIFLNFTSKKFETHFDKDMSENGVFFVKGYCIIIAIEVVSDIIPYIINNNTRDLGMALINCAQLLLGIGTLSLTKKYVKSRFNILVCLQSIVQAIINCMLMNVFHLTEDKQYINNLMYSLNIVLKHVFLMQGSSVFIKIMSSLNTGLVYLLFSMQQTSLDSLRHLIISSMAGILLHMFQMVKSELSLRKHFLLERSEQEMNFLVKRVLPVSMLITRYDKKDERIHFHMSNTKLQKQFQMKDDESMVQFLMNIELQPLDSYQHHILQNQQHQSLFQHIHLQAKQLTKRKSSTPNYFNNPNFGNSKNNGNQQGQNTSNMNNNQITISISNDENRKIVIQTSASKNLSKFNSGVSKKESYSENHNNVISALDKLLESQNLDTNRPLNPQSNFSNSQNNSILNALNLNRNRVFSLNYQLQPQLQYQQESNSPKRSIENTMTNRNQSISQLNEGEVETQKVIQTMRKKEHKRTIIKQFDNLQQSSEYKDNSRQQSFYTQQNSLEVPDISDEVFDRLEVFQGIIKGDSQKILNIKIYSFHLEEVYQVIIFEDETLQSKVNYLQKLNRYYIKLFDSMLKKLRIPISQSLFKTKKSINEIKQTCKITLSNQAANNQNIDKSTLFENVELHPAFNQNTLVHLGDTLSEQNSVSESQNDNSSSNSNSFHSAKSGKSDGSSSKSQQSQNQDDQTENEKESENMQLKIINNQRQSQKFSKNSLKSPIISTLHKSQRVLRNLDEENDEWKKREEKVSLSYNSSKKKQQKEKSKSKKGISVKSINSINNNDQSKGKARLSKSARLQNPLEQCFHSLKSLKSVNQQYSQSNLCLPPLVNKKQMIQLIQCGESLQYSNYKVLNNLYNYQDTFRLFTQKNNFTINPVNISLNRIIRDLKSIFQYEYSSRQLELYFINKTITNSDNTSLESEDYYINTDEKYFKQLLINIISNSLEALSKGEKGYTAIQFRLNPENEDVLDIWIVDSAGGIDEEMFVEESIILQNLNMITLQKNMQKKELKIGLSLSKKIIGKLGPFEKIVIDDNVLKFQIFKDYFGLVQGKSQPIIDPKMRKSFFNSTRGKTSENLENIDGEEDKPENENDIILYEVHKMQINQRKEVIPKHLSYFTKQMQ